MPLALFFALAGVCAWRWLALGEHRALGLLALFAAATCATKFEGLVLVGALLLVLVLLIAGSSRRRAALTAAVGLVALVGVLPWRLWMAAHDVHQYHSIAQGLHPETLWSRLDRIPTAVWALLREMLDPSSWLLLVPIALAAAVLAIAARERRASALAARHRSRDRVRPHRDLLAYRAAIRVPRRVGAAGCRGAGPFACVADAGAARRGDRPSGRPRESANDLWPADSSRRVAHGVLTDRRLLLGAIVLLAVVCRVVGLGDRLTADEGYSWLVASAPDPGAFFDRLAMYENTPPLFYALLAPLPLDDEVWIRLPAVMAGIAAVPVLYAIVRPLMGTRAALLAALGLAVAPLHVAFSNYARGFTLAGLGSLLALWAVARLAQGASRRWWWLYALGAALAVYSEYYAPLFLLPLLGALLALRVRPWREVVALGLAPMLLIAALASRAFPLARFRGRDEDRAPVSGGVTCDRSRRGRLALLRRGRRDAPPSAFACSSSPAW